MKRCPTCDKTFEDNLKFCQLDGTPLVDDEPAFDPYATIVATPASGLVAPDPEPGAVAEVPSEAVSEAQETEVHQTIGSMPITPPDDVLEMPSADPLKTMYVSDAELQEVMGGNAADEPDPLDLPAEPEPPAFTEPDVPVPSFGVSPPPSPFAASEPEPPASEPDHYIEPETMIQSAPVTFPDPEPQPVAPPPQMFEEPAPPPPMFNEPMGGSMEPQFGQYGGFQSPVPNPNKNQTLAIVSLISGLVGLFFCLGLTGPVALITGFMARKRASQSPDEYGGETLALIGIITGALATLLLLAFVAYFAFVFLIVGAGIMAG
ncbi:MAG: DUF4190 domain-containing protein [Acidobacteriota bacterium]|nr:MAG: DUF4190 domain-containing protein [Acidobacteriota bacterium]